MSKLLNGVFRRRNLSTSVFGAFWAASAVIFINDNVVVTTFVEGESMAPTLSPDYHETRDCDWVLWNKLFSRSALQRGDVVQFGNPYKPEGLAVKRIIGLEGDVILLDKRRKPQNAEGPEMHETRAWDAWKGKAVVPPGHVWVEGDNVRHTIDSNYYGPVSMALIEGRAVAVVSPSKFWTKPWEGYQSRTKVIQHQGKLEDWTKGLPVELAEIGGPHLPP
ncbi:hypothetical protein LTR09_002240 [Extremus antarcticus]|uniref:Mitochondrial inner membrane protease subunit n=1 Tax=Extremus antarcticus TaxID=702011 RepID=A0AAJ0GGP5_9PEZI|nr:hypothetical protein LTR09_002240 [Extremus antarcticus]